MPNTARQRETAESFTLADDLRRGMKERHLRVEHVAVEVGVSVASVYAWLSGAGLPGYEHYVALCRMFGWPHRELSRRSVHSRKHQATRARLDASPDHSPDRGDGTFLAAPVGGDARAA